MSDFEPLPSAWTDPENRDAVERLLAPPHLVESIVGHVDFRQAADIVSRLDSVPDGAVVVLVIDSTECDEALSLEILASVHRLQLRGVEVGSLIRRCPGSLLWAVTTLRVCGLEPCATVSGANLIGVSRSKLCDDILAIRPGASRRMISRLLRDHSATGLEVAAAGLGSIAESTGEVASLLLTDLENRLNREEV